MEALKRELEKLGVKELQELLAYIQTLLEERQGGGRPSAPEPEVWQEIRRGKVAYRQQRVKCGKPGCKCAKGELHGPYWYAYWWENGKTRSKYIGKVFKELKPSALR